MDTFKWLLPLLLLWPAIKLAQIISATRIVRGIRFGDERIGRLAETDVPWWFRESIAPAVRDLEALGFAPLLFSIRRSLQDEAFDTHARCLVHPEDSVTASARLYASAAREGAAYVQLHNTLSDGRELVTAAHAELEIVPRPAEIELEIHQGATPADLLTRHRARLAEARLHGAAPIPLDSEGLIKRGQALASTAYALLRDSGMAVPIDVPISPNLDCRAASAAPVFVFRWGPAFSAAKRILQSTPKEFKTARAAGAAPSAHLSDAARTEIEARHYRQFVALQSLRMAWLPKTLIMLGTLVLFALALGWSLSSAIGLVVIAALAFHEGGHLLGMRLFGYKDTQLLFLPFLGGVAVARDRLVLAPWKHLVILFLGPLPGILVGIGLLLWGGAKGEHAAFLTEAGMVVLIFNAFNLLPFLPLDGGQIVDVALVSRFPRLRVFFLLLSGVALIAIGYGASSILLKFFGLLMLFRLPTEWKQASIIKRLRAELPPSPAEELVRPRLLQSLRETLAPKLGAVQRIQLVRGLEERIRRPRPGWGTVALAIAGYVAPIVLGLGLALVVNIHRGENRVEAARARVAAVGLDDPAKLDYSVVPDADNAALPLLELERLLADEWEPEEISREKRSRAIELVREADSRPGFAPDTEFMRLIESSDQLGLNGLFAAYSVLTSEAKDRLRYRDTRAAIDLAARGFSLLRHLRLTPRGWPHGYDRLARQGLWRIVEDSLAQGAEPTAAELAVFARATDETALLAYIHASLRESRIQAARWLDDTESGEDAPPFLGSPLHLATRLFPDFYDSRVEHHDNTIAIDAALRSIRSGRWPEAPAPEIKAASHTESKTDAAEDADAESSEWNEVDWQLDNIGDDVAEQRLAAAGLALLRHLARGLPVPADAASIDGAGSLPPLRHPRIGATMKLEERGEFLVLGIPVYAQPDESDSGWTEQSWRVPKQR